MVLPPTDHRQRRPAPALSSAKSAIDCGIRHQSYFPKAAWIPDPLEKETTIGEIIEALVVRHLDKDIV
jgi:hypothetical protein